MGLWHFSQAIMPFADISLGFVIANPAKREEATQSGLRRLWIASAFGLAMTMIQIKRTRL
ncbi:hypothetical protein NVSP9465_00823 [Novosphingobium sp. CECT 9465]|nr:hypothetical protein NVSP9465_00823 [Novosphingobium sp. CECT 9465]